MSDKDSKEISSAHLAPSLVIKLTVLMMSVLFAIFYPIIILTDAVMDDRLKINDTTGAIRIDEIIYLEPSQNNLNNNIESKNIHSEED